MFSKSEDGKNKNHLLFYDYCGAKMLSLNTDKKYKKIFLIYKEIHMGAVAKSFMRKCANI